MDTEMKIIPIKLDVAFKKMFCDINNIGLLHDFLSSILEIPYDDIQNVEVLTPFVLPEKIGNKISIMDLKIQVDNRIIDVEMQMYTQTDFKDRTLYYWAKLFCESLQSGDKYGLLKDAIAVNILNFNMFDCEDYHSHFKVMEESRHEVLSDKCSIHFFELPKLNKRPDKNNKKELWLQLINAETEDELIMLNNTGVPTIQTAVKYVHEISADEEMREIARLREKALHDEASLLADAEERGVKKGIIQGEEQGRRKERDGIRLQMQALGMPEEQIRAILGE